MIRIYTNNTRKTRNSWDSLDSWLKSANVELSDDFDFFKTENGEMKRQHLTADYRNPCYFTGWKPAPLHRLETCTTS